MNPFISLSPVKIWEKLTVKRAVEYLKTNKHDSGRFSLTDDLMSLCRYCQRLHSDGKDETEVLTILGL